MIKSIVQNWQANNNINLYLLDAISPEHLSISATERGRSVEAIFLHMADVRNKWLSAMAPQLVKKPTGSGSSKDRVKYALSESGGAVRKLIEQVGDAEGRVKGFKPNLLAFVSYLMSHDAHHRGQIMLTLKLGGQRVDNKVAYGMWDWAHHMPD